MELYLYMSFSARRNAQTSYQFQAFQSSHISPISIVNYSSILINELMKTEKRIYTKDDIKVGTTIKIIEKDLRISGRSTIVVKNIQNGFIYWEDTEGMTLIEFALEFLNDNKWSIIETIEEIKQKTRKRSLSYEQKHIIILALETRLERLKERKIEHNYDSGLQHEIDSIENLLREINIGTVIEYFEK